MKYRITHNLVSQSVSQCDCNLTVLLLPRTAVEL